MGILAHKVSKLTRESLLRLSIVSSLDWLGSRGLVRVLVRRLGIISHCYNLIVLSPVSSFFSAIFGNLIRCLKDGLVILREINGREWSALDQKLRFVIEAEVEELVLILWLLGERSAWGGNSHVLLHRLDWRSILVSHQHSVRWFDVVGVIIGGQVSLLLFERESLADIVHNVVLLVTGLYEVLMVGASLGIIRQFSHEPRLVIFIIELI